MPFKFVLSVPRLYNCEDSGSKRFEPRYKYIEPIELNLSLNKLWRCCIYAQVQFICAEVHIFELCSIHICTYIK